MPSPTDLEAAGRRAATQPVPHAPPLATLQSEARQRQNRRRIAGSSVAAAVLLAAGIPLGLGLRDSAPVETVSAAGPDAVASFVDGAHDANDGQSETDAASEGTEPSDDGTPAPPPEPGSDGEHIKTADFEIRLGDGVTFSVKILSGDEARAAATAAAATADETKEVDGVTLWIETDDDRSTVSTRIDGEFISVRGPADQLAYITDLITTGDFDLPPTSEVGDVEEFDKMLEEFAKEFGNMFEGGDFTKFEEFFESGDFSRFEEMFENGEFPNLGEFFEDGDFSDLEELFGEGGFGQLDEFFGEGCVSIKVDGTNGPEIDLQIPEGCDAN